MKKIFLLLFLASIGVAAAEPCSIGSKLINQDPYPAVPGDYVKLVFQLDGLENPECGQTTTFQLIEKYPISFDEGENGIRTFDRVSFIRDYKSSVLIPIKVRLSEDALDGHNMIEARIKNKNIVEQIENYTLEVEDVRADFEVDIQDYNENTYDVTIQILNIADSDVKALTIEIPKQKNIELKGPSRIIFGDLDSNDFTTASFKAKLSKGALKFKIYYSDKINVRRSLEKEIEFDPEPFKRDEEKGNAKLYIILILVLAAAYFLYKKSKRKN